MLFRSACLAEVGASAVGFEAEHVTVAKHEWWLKATGARMPGVSFHATERVVERARIVKDAFEQAVLRDAAHRLTPVVGAVLDVVRAGTRERDVAAILEAALRDAGYERPSFDTIVASGPNSALPHYRAGDRRLATGDLVVLDFGGVLDGYCSDLTRTVSIGPASREARRLYDEIGRAHV